MKINIASTFENGKPLSYYKVTKKNLLQLVRSRKSSAIRSKFTKEQGWSIVTSEEFDILARALRGRKVIDIGGGNGLYTRELRRRKIDIALNDLVKDGTTDWYSRANQFVPVDLVGPISDFDISNANAFIMAWPSYDKTWTEGPVRRMKSGDILIYNGEGYGGCTGTNKFHDIIESDFIKLEEIENALDAIHITFGYVYDSWYIYVKK